MIELCVTAAKHSGESKMDELTVGTMITLIKEIDSTKPVGSTATVVYIDDFKQIFVDWSDSSQGQFTEEQLEQYFEIPTKIA